VPTGTSSSNLIQVPAYGSYLIWRDCDPSLVHDHWPEAAAARDKQIQALHQKLRPYFNITRAYEVGQTLC
jgi:hypothetical protein